MNTLIEVIWLDSRGCHSGWQWLDDLDTSAVVVTSVGQIVAEDDESITLAPHIAKTGEDVQCMGAVTIAKCQIFLVRFSPSLTPFNCCETGNIT